MHCEWSSFIFCSLLLILLGLADILDQVECLQTQMTTQSLLLADELEELQGLKHKWFELYIELGSLASGPPILTLIPYNFFTATIHPALRILNQDDLLYRMQHTYHYWGLEACGVPTPSCRSRLQIFLSRQARLWPLLVVPPTPSLPNEKPRQNFIVFARLVPANQQRFASLLVPRREVARLVKAKVWVPNQKLSTRRRIALRRRRRMSTKRKNQVPPDSLGLKHRLLKPSPRLSKLPKSSTTPKTAATKTKPKTLVAKKIAVEEPETSGEEESNDELAASVAPSSEESDSSKAEAEPPMKKTMLMVKPLLKVPMLKKVILKATKISTAKFSKPKASITSIIKRTSLCFHCQELQFLGA
ncbi:hypothetical protein C8J56DRAFT_893305 [Mycena floridula]|nr:hypothetical protein C8J56DRAFT_893305 [Mycena floridula]